MATSIITRNPLRQLALADTSALPSAYPNGITIEFTNSDNIDPVKYGVLITLKAQPNRGCQLLIGETAGASAAAIRQIGNVSSWYAWKTLMTN